MFTLRKETWPQGFTLLELLIVISIIAILSVIVILVLNPSEMLKKARDSQRMADLNTVKTAIGLYLAGTNVPYLGLNGTSNTGCAPGSRNIWFSKSGVSGTVDTDATATSSASQSLAGKTNGSGWIPVNLSSLSGGSPISNWPVDPANSVANLSAPADTDLVYRYSCNSAATQFEIDATLESKAYTQNDDKRASDGGNNSNFYESGTNLAVMNDPSAPTGIAVDPITCPTLTTCPTVVDKSGPGVATVTTPLFSTGPGSRCLVAIATADNSTDVISPTSVTTVNGTGVGSWTKVVTKAVNGFPGACEIWTAPSTNASGVQVNWTHNYATDWAGSAITVIALSGAQCPGAGVATSTHSAADSGVQFVTITSTASNSFIVGAATNWDAPTTFTALSNTQILTDQADGVGDEHAAMIWNGPVTAGVPITFGSSAPSMSHGCMAAVEILSQ